MLNDLLGIFVKALMGLFDNAFTAPLFKFLEAALFGGKDPLT